ncbi:MAG: ATP-binding protein [Bacillota bacterium]
MPSLRDVIEAERSRLFVGREAERHLVAQWLDDPTSPTRVLFVWGMGGIGKTALLAEMRRTARLAGAVTLWLDGTSCSQSPAAVLDHLDHLVSQARHQAAGKPAGYDQVDRLCLLAEESRRVVLIVDNYHELARFGGWMREEVFGRLPDSGVLVILASRPGPSAGWSTDHAWWERMDVLPLAPLTRAESLALLERMGVSSREAQEPILQAAAGLPLALALLAGAEQPAQAISAKLLREVAAEDQLPLLEALSLLAEADQDLLAEVVGEPVPSTQYHQLSRLSFVHPTNHGVAIQPVAREHLMADLHRRTPDRFRSLRRRALEALQRRLTASQERRERRCLSGRMLSLCRDALPSLEGYADLTVRPWLPAPTPFRPEDEPVLHQQLGRSGLGRELDRAARELLDTLCRRSPESIRVVRSPEGEPLAFSSLVLLHRETVPLLQGSPLGALYLENCPREERAALMGPPASADTYYLCLSGAVSGHPIYHTYELISAAYLDMLPVLGEGARILCAVADPAAISFLRLLGFRVLVEYGSGRLEVLELDLRRRDFGSWVAGFIRSMEGLSPAGSTPAKAREAAGAEAPILSELRTALTKLSEPEELAETALARRLSLNGGDLRKRLLTLISTSSAPAPLTPEDQALLRATYVEKHGGPEAIAMRFHLSRATYYRRLAAAVANLAGALESQAVGVPSRPIAIAAAV